MRRRRLALAAVALAASWAATVQAADLPTDALQRINGFRTENGLQPFRMEARLARLAQDHARDMVERQYFDTRSPAGETLESMLRHAGYAYRQAAHQIAVGYRDGATIADHWLKRGDSRQTLLSRNLSEIGIGYARRGTGALDHYWVIVLAQPTRKVAADWRMEVLRLVNRYRARYGLKALTLNERLNLAAQSHADDMAARDYFDHVTPDGKTVGDRATRAGYRWRTVLENLAAGQGAPSEVVAGWIGSPPHRRAMLAADVDHAGIGYHFLVRDGGRTRQHHYWTLNMARPQ